MSAAAPKPFSSKTKEDTSKSIHASPFAKTSVSGGFASQSPFGFSTAQTGSKNAFGSTSAFDSGSTTANENASSGSGTGFSFGKSTHPTPFGASSANNNPSPFGAPANGGGAAFGGSGKLNPPNNTSSVTANTTNMLENQNNGISSDVDFKAKLTEFYKEHNPSKISSVTANLAKYEGKEDELFRKLYQKYGLNSEGKKRSLSLS